MQISYKTRGNLNPQGRPRVYYTGHPNDFSLYFEKITEEILEFQNCAVYYDTGYSDAAVKELTEEEQYELSQMQLFVIPVTGRFLFQPNRAREVEFLFAVRNHIPVLPLMQERGLEAEFNRICGDLQMLDVHCQDPTALPYEEKLKKFLDAVLIEDELAEKIRAAFDAYIFLSYRKKDRRSAQELMRLIHKNELCRDIAIWYDEFLTPGEDFNKAIGGMLEKSELFVLAVTPHILEPENYVMTTEYPAAKKSGKPVFPVELEETDKEKLEKYYQNLPPCASVGDEGLLQENLRLAIRRTAVRENDASPEHNFLVGLAYLKGMDVEVDHDRALRLITGAAEAGLIEASEKLVEMYRNGEGTKRDYREALRWQKRLTEQREREYAETGEKEAGENWINALCTLGDYQMEFSCLSAAEEAYRKIEKVYKKLADSPSDRSFRKYQALVYKKLGDVETKRGNWPLAQDYYTEAFLIKNALYEEEPSLNTNREIAVICNCLGNVCREQKDLVSAKLYYLNALQISLGLCDLSPSAQTQRELSNSYGRVGKIFDEEHNWEGAKDIYLRKLALDRERCVEAKHNFSVEWDYAGSLNGMGNICRREGNLQEAEDYYLQSMEQLERICSEVQTSEAQMGLIQLCQNLGGFYDEKGMLDEAEKYYRRSYEKSRKLLEEAQTFQIKQEFLSSCISMCDICQKKGELLKAKEYGLAHLDEQWDCFDKKAAMPPEKKLLALAYSKVGDICWRMGETEEAVKFHQSCCRLCEEIYAETGTEQAERDLKASRANVEAALGKRKKEAVTNKRQQGKFFSGITERLRHIIKK